MYVSSSFNVPDVSTYNQYDRFRNKIIILVKQIKNILIVSRRDLVYPFCSNVNHTHRAEFKYCIALVCHITTQWFHHRPQ